jgi:phage gpG-like protein
MANLSSEKSRGGARAIANENEIFSIGYDDKDVAEALRKIRSRGQNLSAVYGLWGEYMLLSVDLNYELQKDPFGAPWRPNSPYTIALKKSLGRINKILQSTGLLRSSYSYRMAGGGVQIGTNDPKAYKHQFGIGVPQRVHLGVSTDDLAELKLTLLSYVIDGDESSRIPTR